MIIYRAVNKINGKMYVGRTSDSIDQRIYEHWKANRYPIDRALRKYGIQSFELAIIDEAPSREVADEKERYWIEVYDCRVPKGYNITPGGEGWGPGMKHTEEAKEKMRKPKNYVRTEDHKRKLGLAHIGKVPWNKGKRGVNKANVTSFSKGQEPWNKGKTNVYSEAVINKLRDAAKRQWASKAPKGEIACP